MRLQFRPQALVAFLLLCLTGIAVPFADNPGPGPGTFGVEVGTAKQGGPEDLHNGTDHLPCDTCGDSDPIELATGELKYSRVDLTLPGALEPFAISFQYHSQRHNNGHYGYGWYFPFEMRLFQHANGDVRWRVGTAEPQRFVRKLVGAGYDSPGEFHVGLTKQIDGSFTMTERTGVVYDFSAEGLLEKISDRVGNETLIAWEENPAGTKAKFVIAGPGTGEIAAMDYRIATITTDLGHVLTFSYYDNMMASREGRLKSITDENLRVVNYAYDSDGNLQFVTSPVTTFQDYAPGGQGATVMRGRVTEYVYSPSIVQRDRAPSHPLEHNLLKVIDDRGLIQLENQYDANDRLVIQEFNGAISSYMYAEDSSGNVVRTTEINGNGFETIYTFDPVTSLPSQRQTKSSGVHGSYIGLDMRTFYLYNSAAELTSISLPEGNYITYKYEQDSEGNSNGNMIEMRRQAGLTEDSTNDIVRTYTYEPLYNQLATSVDALNNTTTYIYDYMIPGAYDFNLDGITSAPVGNLVEIHYPDTNLADGTPQSGITYQFEYNDQGQLIWQGTPGWDDLLEPKGVVTERFYYGPGDHYGRLEKIVVDPSGLALTTLFEYDTFGNLTKVTDPRTNSTTFAVNEMRELTAVDAPLSVGMKLIRDANGNVVRTEVNRSNDPLAGSITLGAPIVTVSTYDAWNRLISSEEDVTASSTRTWTYTYDGLSNLKTATSPEGRAEKFEYDELNFPWRHTRGLGTPEQSTNITHVDENGRIRQLIDGNGNATDLTYDDYDRVVSVQDPNTDIVTIQYNKRDEVTERTILDGAAARRKVRFDYDQLGRLKEVAEVDVSMSPDSDQVTLFQYAKDSRLDSRQSPRGFDTDFDYDSARRLVSTTDQLSNSSVFELDANGNRTKTTSIEQIPGNPTPEVFVATHDYDELNRLVQNQQVDRLDAMHKLTSTFQYDLRHNPLQVTDSIGRVHTATFDLANRRLTSTEDSANLSITTSLEYDNDNLPVKLTDADGFETTTTFDSKGRSTRVDYDPATGLFESYTYDLGDRLLTHRTQDGVVTTFTYNDDNTLASRSTGTLLESFTWNALDQVITADSSDFIGQAISLSFDYDGFSRLVNENQGTYTVSSDYDASNNRDTCTYPTGGPTLTNAFDSLERLQTINDGSGNFATYDYAGRGRMNTCQTGPTTQTFGWDGLRRLTDIDAGSVHDLAYGYDDFNRRTFKQYEHLLPTVQGDVYDYDGGSRLSDVWYDDANPTAGAPGTSLAHLNIQQSKVQARISTTFNMVTTPYSIGDPLHRTTSINSIPRTYDDKGNLTDNGAGRKFEYDAWNRMTRVLDGTGAELVRYEFDALGRRYQRIEGGTTTTRYVYDGPRLLEEYVDPGTGTFTLATRYIYGGGLDELIAIETGGQRYYTYRDALGSIEAITDSAGVVVERYDYDAFGVPTVTDGLGVPTPLGIYGEPTSQYGNDLWFTGARWDPESGNYHMRMRQYEPAAGRFVSRDPLGYVDGPNAYSYGYSDPANWTDPFGLEAGGSSGGNLPLTGLETSPVIDPNNIPIDPRTGRPPQHLFPFLTPEQRRTPRAAVEAQVASQWAGAYSGTSDTAVMAQDHAMAADADFNVKFTAYGLASVPLVYAAPALLSAAAPAASYAAPIVAGRVVTGAGWLASVPGRIASFGLGAVDQLRRRLGTLGKPRVPKTRSSGPSIGPQHCSDTARAGVNSAVVRTTRSGRPGVRITNPDGTVIDITHSRVKLFKPNSHPKAPAGTLQKVKFENPQPGSKGSSEIRQAQNSNYWKTPSTLNNARNNGKTVIRRDSSICRSS